MFEQFYDFVMDRIEFVLLGFVAVVVILVILLVTVKSNYSVSHAIVTCYSGEKIIYEGTSLSSIYRSRGGSWQFIDESEKHVAIRADCVALHDE